MRNAVPLTQGRYRDEFEEAFRKRFQAPFAFSVINATAALELSAQLCQFQPGDELITPSHTYTSSVYPFIKNGARPVWADIDLKTRVVTAQSIEACISEKTKAILVVHLYGYVAEMDAIQALARERNLLLIEDAAQSIGCDYQGVPSGTMGDFGVYSFHSHKNISTLGEGGMLVVQNPDYAQVIPLLRHNGHCVFEYEREDYWVPAMGNVDLPQLGSEPLQPNNYCLGEVECALGTVLLKRLDSINTKKRARALEFIDELRDFEELEFHRVDSNRHNYHLLAARMVKGSRDQFIRKMAYEKGIQCVVQYYPLHRYDYYKKLGFGEAYVPHTDQFFDQMISFPFHHWISDGDLETIVGATRDVLKEIRDQ